MLAKPKFFNSPSEARAAANMALETSPLVCPVNDVFSRVDPDEGKWFAIIILDTDLLPTLLNARKRLPDFRVIGELLPESDGMLPVSHGARRLGSSRSTERARRVLA